jgi:hypothetical protein
MTSGSATPTQIQIVSLTADGSPDVESKRWKIAANFDRESVTIPIPREYSNDQSLFENYRSAIDGIEQLAFALLKYAEELKVGGKAECD